MCIGGVERWVLEVLVRGGWMGVTFSSFPIICSITSEQPKLRCVAQIINSSVAYEIS